MEKRNLYVIVAIVLVAGLILSFTTPTGHQVEIGETPKGCMDSDGDDPTTPGSASYTNRPGVHYDECYAQYGGDPVKYVKEKVCIGAIETKRYYCEDGCIEDANGIGYCPTGRILEVTW